jgi:steroid 5-alpha reductase family enzyme
MSVAGLLLKSMTMNPTLLLISALIIFIFMNIMFVIAQIKTDNSIIDIGWGLGFLAVVSGLILNSESPSTTQLVFLGMIAVWALRLAGYIFKRNRGIGEDYRYAAWREEWGKNVVWRAYLQVFMLQGFIMFIVLSPSYAQFSNTDLSFGIPQFVGMALWIIGFYFEAVGDAQMMSFKSDSSNKGEVMNRGLWKFTRHPNYFGEALLWWGFGIFSLSVELWWLSLIGPAVITFFLLKVSGVAMLERKYDGNSKYAEYQRTTNAFLPWFPKKLERKG